MISNTQDARFATARLNMVEGQIRPNKVTDFALVQAILAIPRERFVPAALQGVAYVDEVLQLAPGRYLLEPMVLARLLQEAQIQPTDRVLIIGGATGYAAAVLAQLAAEVVLLESDAALAAQAASVLAALGVSNVQGKTGPLAAGLPEAAPFDVILIDGAVAAVPPALDAQLAEGGRLVTVKFETESLGRAILREKTSGIVSSRVLFDAATPLLPGFEPKPEFVF